MTHACSGPPGRALHALVKSVVLCSAAGLSLGCAQASPQRAGGRPFDPQAGGCKAATPTQLAWLAPEAWAKFAAFVRVCEIGHGGTPPALLVVSVWADPFYDQLPASEPAVTMPMPLLLAPDGRKLGELPMNFPSDPPEQLTLRFDHWSAGPPGDIFLCVLSPTVSGNRPLPSLHYLPAKQRYEADAKAPAPKKKEDCNG